jgi:hypothetical protein
MVSFKPQPLYPRGKNPFTHWIGSWVGPRAGLDEVQNKKFLTLPEHEPLPVVQPVASRYTYNAIPASWYGNNVYNFLKCRALIM